MRADQSDQLCETLGAGAEPMSDEGTTDEGCEQPGGMTRRRAMGNVDHSRRVTKNLGDQRPDGPHAEACKDGG